MGCPSYGVRHMQQMSHMHPSSNPSAHSHTFQTWHQRTTTSRTYRTGQLPGCQSTDGPAAQRLLLPSLPPLLPLLLHCHSVPAGHCAHAPRWPAGAARTSPAEQSAQQVNTTLSAGCCGLQVNPAQQASMSCQQYTIAGHDVTLQLLYRSCRASQHNR
jgi:hypothetical protein